jgi:transglutaminase-like putative cysteine protease
MLQSDAPQIMAIAAQIAAPGQSDTRNMELLTRKVVRLLPHVDFVGHYSALEALARRGGDCTESAALLAALGRAAGIPTRVANGLVYSRERYHGVSNVFMPHSWVIAWVDGKWQSFDAALGDFDSTHIALNINDGDQRSAFASQQLAGLLRWDGMQEVKARPVE